MKPRLRRYYGYLWCCMPPRATGKILPLGHGYTPQEAYKDWKEQTK